MGMIKNIFSGFGDCPIKFLFQIQIASMCMCINISATVALGCLFTPKVYIVMFQPSKNVRQANAPVSSKNLFRSD